MAKKLSPWCKEARIKMLEENMTVTALAKKAGMSRCYASKILNDSFSNPSERATKIISDILNISDTALNGSD